MIVPNGQVSPGLSFFRALEGLAKPQQAGEAAVLLLAGGLSALQTASIAAALPFWLIMIAMIYGLLKALSEEQPAVNHGHLYELLHGSRRAPGSATSKTTTARKS